MTEDKIHHSKYYRYLEEIDDYDISTISSLFGQIPRILRIRRPTFDVGRIRHAYALLCALYLTGGRISEVTEIKVSNINVEDGWLRIRLPNRKNKKSKTKLISIRIDLEKFAVVPFLKYYIRRYKQVDDYDLPLFNSFSRGVEVYDDGSLRYTMPITVRGLRNLCYDILGWNPHFFRKIRATYLLKYYSFDAKKLQKYMGWSTIISSEAYINMSTHDMEAQIMENYERVKLILEKQ